MTHFSEWVAVVPNVGLVLCALLVPGMILGWSARLRGLRLLIASPLLSAFLIGTGAVVAAYTPLRWGWVPLGLWTLVVCAPTALLFRSPLVSRAVPPPVWGQVSDHGAHRSATVVALAVGTVLASLQSAWGMMVPIGVPSRPPQAWDSVFHLSAVRWILDTGDGSTLHLGAVSMTDGAPSFYPAGWHDLAALAYTGDVVVATNVTAIVVAALLWPFAVGTLATTISPNSRSVAFLAPLLASTFTAFPERVASWGTLWPTLLAYSLVPMLLAMFLRVRGGTTFRPGAADLLVSALAVIGIAIVHPTGVFSSIVLGLWPFLGLVVGLLRRSVSAPVGWRVAIYLTPIIAIAAFLVIRTTSIWAGVAGYGGRAVEGTVGGELIGAMVDTQMAGRYGAAGAQWLLAVTLIMGLAVSLFLRGRRWLVLAWAAAVYLYLVASTLALPGYSLVAAWYSDPVRLGAIVPLIAAPVCALGVGTPVEWLLGKAESRLAGRRGIAVVVLALVFTLCFVATSGYGRARGSHQMFVDYHQEGQSGPNGLVSDAELAMMRRVGDELPAHARVIGSPMNGSALLYPVGNVNVVFRHVWSTSDPQIDWIVQNFGNILTDPKVCQALDEQGIHYYYADSLTYLPGMPVNEYYAPVANARELTDHMQLVDSGGTASVWYLSMCSQ